MHSQLFFQGVLPSKEAFFYFPLIKNFMVKNKGRPKQAVRQERNIGFYVKHSEYAVIKKKADAACVTISDYMRQVAINGRVKKRWTDAEWRGVKELIGISDALNRLADRVGMLGCEGVAASFVEYRDKFDNFLKKTYAR